MKVSFPLGRSGDAKVVFFLTGSFSRNREVFKDDGLIRWIFIFFDLQMLLEKSDVFEVDPDIRSYTKNKAHVQFFWCVKVAPKSFPFFSKLRCRRCRIFLRWNEVKVFNSWLWKSSKMFRGRGKSRVVAMLWSNQNFLSFRRKLRYGRWVYPNASFLKCRLRILEEK